MGQVWGPFGVAEAAIVGGATPKIALTAAAKAIREGIASSQAVRERRAARPAARRPRPTSDRPPPERRTTSSVAPGAEGGSCRWRSARDRIPTRSWGLAGGSTRGPDRQDPPAGGRRGDRRVLAIPLYRRPDVAGPRGVLIVTTVAIFVVYLQPWHIPIKYLVPGTIFLIAVPGHPGHRDRSPPRSRTSATATAGRRRTRSRRSRRPRSSRSPDSAEYVLTIATDGRPGDRRRSSSCCTTRRRRRSQQGTAEGLTPVTGATVSRDRQGHRGTGPHDPQRRTGRVPARPTSRRSSSRPTNGAIKSSGLSRAFEGQPVSDYDAACDCVTDSATGARLDRRQRRRVVRRTTTGDALAQGWLVNVGLEQLHPDVHRPGGLRAGPRDHGLELRLRDPDGADHVRRPACSWRSR